MKLIFHGAAQEVGRSCVEAVTKQYTRILFDAGLKLTHHGHSGYPENVKSHSEIDAVFLSHSHLDHCGALPYFDHNGMDCPIYATGATKLLTKLILEDAFKISRTTYGLIKQNLGISLVYNAVTIPLAMAGYIIPLIAAISMSISSLLVVGNSMRIRYKWNNN